MKSVFIKPEMLFFFFLKSKHNFRVSISTRRFRLAETPVNRINTELQQMMSLSYPSRRLDQRCTAQTGAAGGPGRLYPLHPLQEDSGPGDVAPCDAQSWLHLPAAASCYMVGHLQGPDTIMFSF